MKLLLRSKTPYPHAIACALFYALAFCELAQGSNDQERKIYRSPEERREAGLGTEITEWLEASWLAEWETNIEKGHRMGSDSHSRRDDPSQSLQLGLDATFSESLSAEITFEYEIDYEENSEHGGVDEGVLKFETEDWGVELGRLFVPFGEYFSHFVTGPMTEFGEISGNGLVVDYSASENLDLFLFGVEGKVDRSGGNNKEIEWGMGVELFSADESIKFGVGFLSDLADSDELLLDDFDGKYQRRAPGFSAYALFGKGNYEITAEIIHAMRNFSELDENADKPWAGNLEVAWFPRPGYQLAVRVGASDELSEQPQRQFGLSASWLIGKHINLAADYLYSDFKNGFVFDDNDNELNSISQFVARIGVEF